MMGIVSTYKRVLGLLGRDLRTAAALGIANLFVAALTFLDPLLFGKVVNLLSAGSEGGQWFHVIGIWILTGIASILFSLTIALFSDRMANRNRLRVMGDYHSHALTLPNAFHSRHHSGRVMRTMWTGVDACFWIWLTLFREQLSAFIGIAVLLPMTVFLNPALGAVLLVLVVVFAAMTSLIVRHTEGMQRKAETFHGDLATAAQDAIGNVSVVQAFTRIADEKKIFSDFAQQVVSHQFPVLNWWALVNVITRTSATLAILAIVIVGGALHAVGKAEVGEIVTFMGFAGLIIGRMESMVFFINRVFSTKPQLDDFFSVLDTPSATPEKPDALKIENCTGKVEFRNVGFCYPGGDPVLSDISFIAEPGSCIALVGSTGAGKSTAISLLQRNWDVTDGSILMDGHDIRDISLDALKRSTGIVFQESFLFSRTIRENLLVGKPDATAEELEEACRKAEAHDFIMAQPKGYDTMVGERGTTLSGGQKQRLAIARALLKNPPVLILDEATSALDSATEAKVTRALTNLMKGRTTFIVAHRLSTIRHADTVLVFEGGRIVESGNFNELADRGGRFTELVENQLSPSRNTNIHRIGELLAA